MTTYLKRIDTRMTLSTIKNLTASLKALCLFCALSLPAFYSQALEGNLQIHKGEESGAIGYNLSLADRFSPGSGFGWNVSYNHLSDLAVTWNNDDLFFDSNSVELLATYQHTPKSYNQFLNKLIFEFQAGASVQLTENKFVWEELNEEKYFSEQGDVNGVLAFLTHYKVSRKMQMHVGVKYYPTFSEFDGQGTVFAGFTYRFGNQFGY
ncbi:hypothetical protein [Thalassotalea sp. PLHSN55]|uniref:hypothetical protein n=1 Tax=Thalassotalea sp. PLHSN55 TaxID=3435888 RepID=UPI003F865379